MQLSIMRNIVYYVSVSLDVFIALQNGVKIWKLNNDNIETIDNNIVLIYERALRSSFFISSPALVIVNTHSED